MQMHINDIYIAIYALKEDIDSLYEYMRVLSTTTEPSLSLQTSYEKS